MNSSYVVKDLAEALEVLISIVGKLLEDTLREAFRRSGDKLIELAHKGAKYLKDYISNLIHPPIATDFI